jgi:2-phospho-L-lactate guanylyltransferase (CobY/MobA/RfbA family)
MEKSSLSSFVSKHDRESLLEVRDEYSSLRTLIGSLSTKLTAVSTHIEDEFLSSYRVHMLSVQQELRDLKMQVIKAEEALNEDKQVAALEQEMTWFCDESTRLKNQTTSMKKDIG